MNWKKDLILPTIASAIGGAIATALFSVLPEFWITGVKFFVTMLIVVLCVWIPLYAHNLFYHATFLWIKYLYFYLASDNEKSTEVLKEICTVRPSDPSPYIELVANLVEKKQYYSALDYIDRSIGVSGFNEKLLSYKANIYLHFSKWSDAAKTIQVLLEVAPDKLDWYHPLAQTYFQQDKPRKAIRVLKNLRANLREKAQSFEDGSMGASARKQLWILVDIQEKTIDMFVAKFNSTNIPELMSDDGMTGKWNALIRSLKRAINKAPGDFDLQTQLVEAYFRIGDFQNGFGILFKSANDILDDVKKLEKQSHFQSARENLWVVVEINEKIINLLERVIIELQSPEKKWDVMVDNIFGSKE
ncbi:MAG: hypothetical protein HYZ21_14440 [Chloroflexi bacterium]|nr:hypothetical protein [Chloroflexota bacterium]